MVINFNGEDRELKYTYNSFKYMENFDTSELANLGEKPFKLLGITQTLLTGAINHNPRVVVPQRDIEKHIELEMNSGGLMQLLTDLMLLLEDSSFFKNLQATT